MVESLTANIKPTNKQDSEYVYSGPVKDDLVCTICCAPFIDPMEHLPAGNAKCGQIYCKRCVEKQQLCPHCRHPARWRNVEVTPSTQRFLYGPLNELKVVCPRCKGQCARGELQNHLGECSGERAITAKGNSGKPKDGNGHISHSPSHSPVSHSPQRPHHAQNPSSSQHSQAPQHPPSSNNEPQVSCPAADVLCPWKGTRKQLAEEHTKQCAYLQLQPLLRQLLKSQTQLAQAHSAHTQATQKLEKRIVTLELKQALPLPPPPPVVLHRKCQHCAQYFFLNTAPPCAAHVAGAQKGCVRCAKQGVVHGGTCTHCGTASSEMHFCVYCKKPADPKKPCNAHPHEASEK